jgi:Arm DNA-binding domain
MELTDLAIKAAKPRDKPFKLSDSHGLFLPVNPGGSKLWRWRYRLDRKEKLMALGKYPIVSLARARELHFTGRKTLAAGIFAGLFGGFPILGVSASGCQQEEREPT